jgi:hypothetical protein
LVAARADSTLLADPALLSMLIIDPNGKIVRTIAAAQADAVAIVHGQDYRVDFFDADGKMMSTRVIAGFGPGGVVYMGVLDGTIARLERARVRPTALP